MTRDRASCHQVNRDFGGLAKGTALAVCWPRDADEVQALCRFARCERLPLTVRGTGYSQSGQAVPMDSLLVQTTRLDRIIRVAPAKRIIECQGRARVRQIVDALRSSGFMPPVLPANLDMTVGGERYHSGWMGRRDHGAWQQHFGSGNERWHQAKADVDPDGVFTSWLFDDRNHVPSP